MTSNYKKKIPITVTQEEYTAALKAEVRDLYSRINADILTQMLAVVLVCLEVNYGWKQHRLRKFINNLCATSNLTKADVFGKTIDTGAMVKYLKNKHNIDLHQEILKM